MADYEDEDEVKIETRAGRLRLYRRTWRVSHLHGKAIVMQPKGLRHYTIASNLLLNVFVKSMTCNLFIDNKSCENIVSRAHLDYLKLDTEPHPHPYTIGWIRKGPSIKVNDICHISVSVDKFYQDFVACNVIDMDTSHILLGRS